MILFACEQCKNEYVISYSAAEIREQILAHTGHYVHVGHLGDFERNDLNMMYQIVSDNGM